jgi:transposase
MPFKSPRLRLRNKQRSQLTAITRRQTAPAAQVLRSRIILGLAEGKSYQTLCNEVHTSSAPIALWRKRFEEGGVSGLRSLHLGKEPSRLTPEVLAKTMDAPPDGSTHWSCRKLDGVLKLSKTLVHRVWQEADLKPHRLDRYMAATIRISRRKPPISSAYI